ncbi:MAG: hypothetical protein ACLGIE_12320 [Alphaproteobacteria bacterium]
MSKEPNDALRRALGAAVVLMLIGGLPFFLRMFGGQQFLPSTTWVAQSFWLAIACAAFCAILPSVVGVRGRIRDGGDRKSIKYLLLLAFVPALGGTLGYNAVAGGGAMLYTWGVGKPTELPYVVKRAKRSVDRKCRNPIALRGMPILSHELCGFPEEFIANLSPGQTLLVSGNGSPLGVFVSTARVAGTP